MEFSGDAVSAMNMEERMTMCNMVVEAGGKNGTCPADETTFDYVTQRTSDPFEPVYSDASASYVADYKFDVSKLEPVRHTAKPFVVQHAKQVCTASADSLIYHFSSFFVRTPYMLCRWWQHHTRQTTASWRESAMTSKSTAHTLAHARAARQKTSWQLQSFFTEQVVRYCLYSFMSCCIIALPLGLAKCQTSYSV